MGKDKIREFFYSGIISVNTREPTAFFCGIWPAEKDETFADIIKAILDHESKEWVGIAVLTAFNKLED